MREDQIQEFMKRHPSWFIFDFHPICFAKKLSGEEQRDKKEGEKE